MPPTTSAPPTTTNAAPPATTPAATPSTPPASPAKSSASGDAGGSPKPAPVISSSNFENPFAEIDRLVGGEGGKDKPTDKPPGETKVEEPKVGEPVKSSEPSVPPGDKPPEAKEGEAKSLTPQVDVELPKVTTAKELRTAYENLKKQHAAARAELEAAKKGGGRQSEEEVAAAKEIQAKLAAEIKRREELETAIQFASYEKSPEYKERYQRPLENAFTAAYEDIKTLDLVVGDTTRKGNEEDFHRLLMMPLAEVSTMAKQMFGDAAPAMLLHRDRIMALNRDRKDAVERFKGETQAREEKMAAEQAAQVAQAQQLWETAIADQVSRYPQFFDHAEGDEEGNETLDKGFALADLAFDNSRFNQLPLEKRIAVHATLRNKAAGFDRLALQHKRLSEKVSALEKELEGYKKSTPGSSDGGNVITPAGGQQLWADEIDSLANLATR